MDTSTDYETHAEAIAALFEATFAASEGREEGTLIGALARRLIAETQAQDLACSPPGRMARFSAASSSRA